MGRVIDRQRPSRLLTEESSHEQAIRGALVKSEMLQEVPAPSEQALDLDAAALEATVPGARTSLWVPELDRLFLGVRASSTEPAAVWVYRPAP